MPSYQNQGQNASTVFAGTASSLASRRIYGESAERFARLIEQCFPDSYERFVLADIGSYKGELMQQILGKLHGRRVETVAVDMNRKALAENRAETRIVVDVAHTRLGDKSVDVAICRCALQWNPPEAQQRILRELTRIARQTP